MFQLKAALLLLLQAVLLTATQVFMKLGVKRIGHFEWTKKYFKELLFNWPMLACGFCGIAAMVLWMVILKKNDFSQAYPLTAVSYILALLAGLMIFNESVTLNRWIGVVIIMIGIYFVAKA